MKPISKKMAEFLAKVGLPLDPKLVNAMAEELVRVEKEKQLIEKIEQQEQLKKLVAGKKIDIPKGYVTDSFMKPLTYEWAERDKEYLDKKEYISSPRFGGWEMEKYWEEKGDTSRREQEKRKFLDEVNRRKVDERREIEARLFGKFVDESTSSAFKNTDEYLMRFREKPSKTVGMDWGGLEEKSIIPPSKQEKKRVPIKPLHEKVKRKFSLDE